MSDGAYTEDEGEEFVDELKPGTELMLGQYTVHSFLAAGGFGITYLAKDSLDRYVVIKECFPGSFCRRQNHSVLPRSRAHQNELKSIVRMFSQEAMSLSKAGHPNVVGVHQVFEENNTAYMALDYVKGSDLLEILTDNPHWLTPDLVQGYLIKMLSAIGHVHNQGILHRDISPDNIIISEEGEPVLIDFGAAREEAGGKASRMLSALRVVKDGYSPQEFYIAGSEQSPSCDLYSLAASFYHIITGDLPPDSQSRLTAFAANEADPYVPLAEIGQGYPANFCTALDKAMSVLPKDRMQSAQEWHAHISGEAAEDQNPMSASVEPKASNKPFLPILLGGAAAAAAAGIGFGLIGGSEPQETPLASIDIDSEVATTAGSADAATDAASAQPIEPLETALAQPQEENAEDVATLFTPSLEDNAPSTDVAEVADTPITSSPEDVASPAEATSESTNLPSVDNAPRISVVPAPRPLPGLEEEDPVVIVEEVPETPGPSPIIVQTQTTELSNDVVPATALPKAPTLLAFDPADLPREAVQLASVSLDVLPSVDVASALPLPEPEPEPEPSETVAEVDDTENDARQLPFAAQETPAFMLAQQSAPTAVTTRDNTAEEETADTRSPADPKDELSASLDAEEAKSVRQIEARSIPFTMSGEPVTDTVADGAPFWLVPGLKIATINGTPVASGKEVVDLIQAAPDETVMIGVDALFTSAVIERPLDVGIELQTILQNGLTFATREVDGKTITRVAAAPSSSNFRVGDILVAYVSTSEVLDGSISIATILERELAAGTTNFSFSVRRQGEIWIEAFQLAGLQQ